METTFKELKEKVISTFETKNAAGEKSVSKMFGLPENYDRKDPVKLEGFKKAMFSDTYGEEVIELLKVSESLEEFAFLMMIAVTTHDNSPRL